MEKALKTLNGLESKHQDTTAHEFTRNSGREKANSLFFRKLANSLITLKQITNLLISYDMKKQLALVLTLTAFLMTACDDEPVRPKWTPGPNPPTQIASPVRINSIYPNDGAPGITVAIFGENFGTSISDNYVTFDSVSADVLYVGHGMLSVRVPMNLAEGSYAINVSANGQVASAPRMFQVATGTN